MNAVTAGRAAEIDRYLDGVTAALADLPEQVRQELLEDLPGHLAEIAADDPAALDVRLGPPHVYAAELRAAAGVDTGKPRHRVDRWAETVAAMRPHVRALDEKAGRLIGYDRLADFLVQLRPAWWIARGYLVGMLLLALFAGAWGTFPHDSSAGLLGWVLVLGLVVVSIRTGRRPLHLSRRFAPKWLAVGGVVAVFAAWSLVLVSDEYRPPMQDSGGYAGYEAANEVYVYDKSGTSITDIRVFNRDGAALPIGVPMGCDKPQYGYYGERRGCLPSEDPADLRDALEPSRSPSPSSSQSSSQSPSPSQSSGQSAGPSGSASPSAS